MRACVIFNPTAKGDKARRFRRELNEFASECEVKLTSGPQDARRLAAEAVREGTEVIIAAGGDGTVNEVLNGIGELPDGFERARLGVMPLGTVNVFARELRIPLNPRLAWQVALKGREIRVDLPQVDFTRAGVGDTRLFAQLAGAGLDARAIELVNWPLKKKIGPLAYVYAGLKAIRGPAPLIEVKGAGRSLAGELVLIGNGRLYGGDFRLFPGADLCDGLLEVCVFPKAGWLALARCGPELLLRGRVSEANCQLLRAGEVTLASRGVVPFEVDGELVGQLPAKFSVHRRRLRVMVPTTSMDS